MFDCVRCGGPVESRLTMLSRLDLCSFCLTEEKRDITGEYDKNDEYDEGGES